MLNTTQITNPACVTRTERLTADEKELRGHCIKGHKTKLELQDDKSCHECVTPARQALRCQKEGALEKPGIRAHAKQWANKHELQSITYMSCTFQLSQQMRTKRWVFTPWTRLSVQAAIDLQIHDA